MSDEAKVAGAIAAQPASDSPFKFCTVTVSSAGVSVVVDYGGTAVTIEIDRIYGCSVLPSVGESVCVGANGTDRFILGTRLA